MFSPEELGKALRLLRARRDLSQGKLATRAKLTKAMISSYELGLQLPSFGSLAAVLGALGEDFHDLQEALAEVQTGRPFKSQMRVESENVGHALRLLRKLRKLRQNAVADKAKITKAMLSCYETGSQLPSLHSLRAVLTALDFDFHNFQEALHRIQGPAAAPEAGGLSFAPEGGGRTLIAAFESLGEEGHTVYVELHPLLRSMNSNVCFKVTGAPPDRALPGLLASSCPEIAFSRAAFCGIEDYAG